MKDCKKCADRNKCEWQLAPSARKYIFLSYLFLKNKCPSARDGRKLLVKNSTIAIDNNYTFRDVYSFRDTYTFSLGVMRVISLAVPEMWKVPSGPVLP